MQLARILKSGAVVCLTSAAMLALNLLPYWRTRGRARVDGFAMVGFPWTFRRVGGFANIDEFRVLAFMADVALALAVAFLAGWLATGARRKPSR